MTDIKKLEKKLHEKAFPKLKKFVFEDIYANVWEYKCANLEDAKECFEAEHGKGQMQRRLK